MRDSLTTETSASARRRRGLIMIALAAAAVSLAMSVQGGANFNFVADEIHASGRQAGMLEAARETCGITALGVLAILAGLAEPLVASSMLVLTAAGICITL